MVLPFAPFVSYEAPTFVYKTKKNIKYIRTVSKIQLATNKDNYKIILFNAEFMLMLINILNLKY